MKANIHSAQGAERGESPEGFKSHQMFILARVRGERVTYERKKGVFYS